MKPATIQKANGRYAHYVALKSGNKGKGRMLLKIRYDANSFIAYHRALDALEEEAAELGYTVVSWPS